MLDQQQTKSLKEPILGMQIICGSLIIGAAVACLVVYFINTNRQFNTDLGTMTLVGICMAATTYVAAFLVPGMIRKASCQSLAASANRDHINRDHNQDGQKASHETLRMAAQHLTQHIIVRFALLEGTMFANLVFWFIEGSLFSWVVIGIGFALMIAFFPFPNRAIDQVESLIADSQTAT